jgi:hypothetical protein
MELRYDLSRDIASFDFFNTLVIGAAKGARAVVFGVGAVKTGKWPAPIVRQRFHSILEPGPALLGLPHRVGNGGEYVCSPNMGELVRWVRAGNDFPRLKSVLRPGRVRYTVTLRNDRRRPERNSNIPAWREFAKQINALVIEDYEDEQIGLHTRMALYAGAEMNFGVPNGPTHLLALSDYPVMMFACDRAEGAFANCGIQRGEQYPWSRPNQRLIWEPDDLSTLLRHFEQRP